ncbi:MAG: reprolysin-like metallopeptidase, partial [Betaproteobacteria bacterium]
MHAVVALVTLGLTFSTAHAGGPVALVNNQPVVYPGGGAALALNLDLGPLGSRTNAQATTLVQNALAQWNAVATSTLRVNVGAPLSSDFDSTNFAALFSNFSDGLNPVIFDTDGSIIDALLGAGQKNNVLGFAGSAYFTGGPSAGRFSEGRAVLNGFLSVSDGVLTTVVAHEIGHFFGMDHAQLDATQGLAQSNFALMYPIAYRTLPTLHEDDAAAVSTLYPSASFGATYGVLDGVFSTAGNGAVRGANIWAVETGTGKVYSVVSDFLMQGNGYFRLALPAGTYTLHAESIHPSFFGGSGVGPYAESAGDISFVAPHPITPVALGGGGGQAITITAGCAASATFRMDSTGSVTGNCAAAAGPGNATISANPYGALTVQGATLNGNTISGWGPSAIIQLGTTPGAAGSMAQIDFAGLSLPAGTSMTIRSGAAGQSVTLNNTTNAVATIDGALVAQSGNGAAVPQLYLHNAAGIIVNATGSVVAATGLTVDTLGASWTIGQTLINQGTLDGGPRLDLFAGKINGSGSFKGNAITVASFGNANNPVNGFFYLSNSLQLFPSTGSTTQLV